MCVCVWGGAVVFCLPNAPSCERQLTQPFTTAAAPQARVFAARDHSGAVPLLEGRTAAGSLIIACGTFLPEGVHQMVDIQPGVWCGEAIRPSPCRG